MKPHEEWLVKALHDLKSANLLFTDADLYDTAIYHTQQCAEKSLKGFLAFKEKEIPKTHSLKVLLIGCSEIDEDFKILTDEAMLISPFATEFRYPGEQLSPEFNDVQDAIIAATKIYDFVNCKIIPA